MLQCRRRMVKIAWPFCAQVPEKSREVIPYEMSSEALAVALLGSTIRWLSFNHQR